MKRFSYLAACILFVSVAAVNGQTRTCIADKSASFIRYHMNHLLHAFDANSSDAYCAVEIDPGAKSIRHVYVQVDVTTFNSGNSNRDSHAMEVIDALSYPDARFESTGMTPDHDTLRVEGRMTFHGITRPLTINVLPRWDGNILTVQGAFKLSLTDYKVERPSLLGLKVDDDIKFTLLEKFKL